MPDIPKQEPEKPGQTIKTVLAWGSSLQCFKCDLKWDDKSDYEKHMKDVHSDKAAPRREKVKCPECSMQFFSLKFMLEH